TMEAGGALLLPGLPNELATQCLIHVPDRLLRAVNRSWRRLLLSDDTFRSIRLSQGHSTALFLAVAPKHRLPREDVHTDNPSYRCFEIDVTANNQRSNYWHLISTLCEREGQQIFKRGHKCVGLGSLVLVIGGKDHFNTGRSTGSAAVHALDRATGRWHKRASMESPRLSRFAAVTHKRRYVFVFGGYIGHEEGFEYLQRAEVYDSLSDKWSPIASIPVPLQIDDSFLFQERIFLEGRSAKGGYQKVVFSYDINLGTWQEESRIAKKIRALRYDSVRKITAASICNSVSTAATLSCSLVAAVIEAIPCSYDTCEFDYLSLYKLENVLDEGLQRDNPSSSQGAERQLSDNMNNDRELDIISDAEESSNMGDDMSCDIEESDSYISSDTDDEVVGRWKMMTSQLCDHPRTLWTLEAAIAGDPSVDLVLVTTTFSSSKQENVSIDPYYSTPKILNVITRNLYPCGSAVVSVVL
ncbi:hypothetical protein GOP47_0012075, partial [Adiantum capillus-veneris]